MQPSSRSKAKLAFQQPPRSASRAAQNRANGKPTPAPSLPITTTAAIETLHPAKPRYTERLDRLQFMAGQVGLYSDHINPRQRPDSKRPQALKKMWNRHGRRVACAKRCGCRTAARRDLPESNLCSGKSGCIAIISTRAIVYCMREAVCVQAQPAPLPMRTTDAVPIRRASALRRLSLSLNMVTLQRVVKAMLMTLIAGYMITPSSRPLR